MTVGILECGFGNVRSIIRMIEKVGGSAKLISTPQEIRRSNKLILPGVGHFDHGISKLIERGLLDSLQEFVIQQGAPILGICLGMQLLCVRSEEGVLPGLGYVGADVKKFQALPDENLKIPHMGWNTVASLIDNPLLPIEGEEQRFYFVHSYKVVPNNPDISIANCDYGGEFCAAFQQGNIFGVQFHPEKSHRFGMELMKRFVKL